MDGAFVVRGADSKRASANRVPIDFIDTSRREIPRHLEWSTAGKLTPIWIWMQRAQSCWAMGLAQDWRSADDSATSPLELLYFKRGLTQCVALRLYRGDARCSYNATLAAAYEVLVKRAKPDGATGQTSSGRRRSLIDGRP